MRKRRKRKDNGVKRGRQLVRFYKIIDYSQFYDSKRYVIVPRYFKKAYEIFFGEMDLASAIKFFNVIFISKKSRQNKRSWSAEDLMKLRLSFDDKSAHLINWYNNGDGRRMDRHHIIPKSRDGEAGRNLLLIPRFFHETYHSIFGNLTPNEAIYFLEIVFTGKGLKKRKIKWLPRELYSLQLTIQLKSIEQK